MRDIVAAVYFSPEMVEELHALRTGWPFSNEACIERALQIRPGWYWSHGAYVAGSRLILAFEAFAQPGYRITIPWRPEFDHWFELT